MVKIKVDKNNRDKLKRLHTATHIINYSAKEVLGTHVWQNGSNLKADIGTLDITHYDNLTQKEIFEIEKLSNQVIFENKIVTVEEIDRTEAEKKHGFTLYQGGAVPMKLLRVVKIENNDIEACGGLHVDNTQKIGLIKITETNKIQDGVIRLKFVVQENAINFIQNKQKILNEVNKVFSVDDKSVVKTSEKFFNEWKSQKKENDKLKDLIKTNYINTIKESKLKELNLKSDFDMGFMMDIFNQTKKDSFKLESEKFIIATHDIKIDKYKKEIKKNKFNIYVK